MLHQARKNFNTTRLNDAFSDIIYVTLNIHVCFLRHEEASWQTLIRDRELMNEFASEKYDL